MLATGLAVLGVSLFAGATHCTTGKSASGFLLAGLFSIALACAAGDPR